MQFHKVANIFPLLEGEEFQVLVEDIRQNGQIEPIWIYQGQIIDGRNRYRACMELGIEPKYREWDGNGSLVQFVVSLNLHRRHLNESQRSMIAARIKPMFEAEAKERQRQAGQEYGRGPEKVKANLPEPIESRQARDDAAKAVNVSPRSVQSADKVLKQGTPELIQAVDRGNIPVSAATLAVVLPEPEQKEIVRQIETGEVKTVKEAIEKKNPHVAYNSGNNEWYTPAPYIEAARRVMGDIDLDPASSEIANQVVGAKQIYTAEDNGLTKDWTGRVWLNPPYAGELIPLFCDKITGHYKTREVTEAIILVNNATETGWFNTLIEQASAVVFPKGRVRFYTPTGTPGAPLQGQAVIYLGQNPDKFLQYFKGFGWGARI